MQSETSENPSMPTFFLALSGEKPFTVTDFVTQWTRQSMHLRHPRFHSRVSHDDRGYFLQLEDTINAVRAHVSEHLHTFAYRNDLKKRIESCLLEPMDLMDRLWEVQISSGPLGSSGAIGRAKVDASQKESVNSKPTTESVLLFRAHHALGDGVSLVAAVSDLCDEAQELREMVQKEIRRRKEKFMKLGFLKKLTKYLQRLVWLCFGSIQALLSHSLLLATTPSNPFDEIRRLSKTTRRKGRSISWCDVAPLDEVKSVAKALGDKGTTVNDVFVSCVTAAVARQIAQHRARMTSLDGTDSNSKQCLALSKNLNVVIPVHLGGGILLPGKSVGNNIGAIVARVPGEMDYTTAASTRLGKVHSALASVKNSPAPILSFAIAKFCSSYLPENWTKSMFVRSNANASVVVTNTRGSPKKLHLNGHTVESSHGFLPLPPGIPIGVVVQSYAGVVSLSLTAEPFAVPDADQFLSWVVEEYKRLSDEAMQNHSLI